MNVKQHLVDMAKKAYADKMFAATSGNLSIYDRETGRMYITPGSYPYEIMTADDVMVIDLDGNIIEGPHKPSSEWRLHAAVYRSNEQASALVHTHSPMPRRLQSIICPFRWCCMRSCSSWAEIFPVLRARFPALMQLARIA